MTAHRQKRGEFTPIARALLDGPDFQRLAPITRHLFLSLKISFGPSGIEVCYPDALIATLAATTGWTAADVAAGLAQLHESGWIDREAHVLWIVAQLQYHPGMADSNEKHRLGIQNHVAGLPRLAIVRRFIERYSAFFSDVPGVLDAYPVAIPPALALVATDAIATRMAIDSHSHHAVRSTQDAIPTTHTQHEELSCPSDAAQKTIEPDPSLLAFAELWSVYPKRSGGNSRVDAERNWKARLKERETPEAMLAGVRRYAAYCKASGKVGTEYVMQASRFLGRSKHYLEPWDVPDLQPEDVGPVNGEIIPGSRFDKLTRPPSAYGAAFAGGRS